MKIAICLIIKDENDYLQEWLNHHRSMGVDHFFIYDNQSTIPISKTLSNETDVTIKIWTDNEIASQCRAYKDCCNYNSEYDYIAFIDTDEFIMLNGTNNIKDFLGSFRKPFDAFAMSWRNYGQPQPYFTEKTDSTNYVYYCENIHVKCFADPKKVIWFPTPHSPQINGICVNELGALVNGPYMDHTSKNIWIKHIWTRSESEFVEKINRGSGDKVFRYKSLTDFINYNDGCTIKDI
jgi:hypothetical protein